MHKDGFGRMSGAGGKALDSPSSGLERSLSGKDGEEVVGLPKGDRNAKRNRPTKANFDCDYGGNVSGPFARTFSTKK